MKINTLIRLAASIIAAIVLNFCDGKAQGTGSSLYPVTLEVHNTPLAAVLSAIERQVPYKFAYNTELIVGQKNVTLKVSAMPLKEMLTTLFRDEHLNYSIIGNQIILQALDLPEKITISGYIRDAATGESLIGASIYLPGTGAGTISNNYGFYSLTIPTVDSADLAVSYIGYRRMLVKFRGRSSVSMNINLLQGTAPIVNVIITGDTQDDSAKEIGAVQMDLSPDITGASPSLSGGGDMIESVLLMPGVQAGLDGAAGYFVRGGNAGQNQVQLDEATLYNPSHLFGLVSIFNPDAIKKARLIKGGFPAAYGDHLSSVLDIAMKDGDNRQFGGIIQAGTVASGITLYGPLISHSASFLISARRSMIDEVLEPLSIENYFSHYYFYDINAKLNYRLSQKDRIFLSLYKGLDRNSYSADSTDSTSDIQYATHFGNQALTLRWNHLYSGKLFSNTSLVYNNYHQFLSATEDDYYAQLYSGIRDINFKVDLSYYPAPHHKISAGVNYLYQTLFPASVSDKISRTGAIININPRDIPQYNTNRIAFYASEWMMLGRKFHLYLGARVPVFFRPGAQYADVEPRLSLHYRLGRTTGLRLSYSRMHQYIHLVQSYNASFPAEIWIGSSSLVRPESSHEVSAGIFKRFGDNGFHAGLDLYYKLMENQVLFKGGVEPAIVNDMESRLVFGEARCYGAEFLIRKSRGRLTGWLSYTLAYAWRQFDSLNMGQRFPFAYDRRHSFYLTLSYNPDKHWKFSADFRLATGRAFTLHSGPDTTSAGQNGNPLYDEEGNAIPADSSASPNINPNNYRLTPYNRLDLSVSYVKNGRIFRAPVVSEWTLSVYNVYAHHNTYFAYRTIDPVTKAPVAKEVTFLPVIPSITYRVRF